MDTARPRWASLRAIGLAAVAAAAVAAAALVGTTPAHGAPSQADLEQQIKQQSTQFEKVVEQYNKITEEQKKTKKRIAAVDKKLKPLSGKVATAQKQVDAIAAAAYKGGPATAWNAVLNGSSSDTLNNIATLNRLSAQQSDQIRSLITAKRKLDGQHEKLAALYAKQSKQVKDLKKKKASISAKVDKLKKLREEAYGSATETTGTGSGQTPPKVSGRAGAVVDFAYAQLGKPYAWAAAGPDSYDCSGLTLAAWAKAGVSLPHVAADQYNQITHISRSQIAPGDLVFYENLGHVAIYVGGGKVIHAPTFGEVVKVSSIDMMPVYGIGRP
jgi:cell wall-associated NlpC family hydrolase